MNKAEVQADECYTTLDVENVPVKFKVDRGAQVNILPLHMYNGLNTESKLVKSDTKLTSYSDNELYVYVKVTTCLKCTDQNIAFYTWQTLRKCQSWA